MELKVVGQRTVESLLSDLERQLLGDYLLDKKSNFGLFVVMRQRTRHRFPHDGSNITFSEVDRLLTERARGLSKRSMGKKHVDVITFECPLGHSPRNAKKKIPKKLKSASTRTKR